SYLLLIFYCCFFFFQAEDGIRDRTVTGVQTCALPISIGLVEATLKSMLALVDEAHRVLTGSGSVAALGELLHASWLEKRKLDARSEERRVGKECRSRW